MTVDYVPQSVAVCPECGGRLTYNGHSVICENEANPLDSFGSGERMRHTGMGWEKTMAAILDWESAIRSRSWHYSPLPPLTDHKHSNAKPK